MTFIFPSWFPAEKQDGEILGEYDRTHAAAPWGRRRRTEDEEEEKKKEKKRGVLGGGGGEKEPQPYVSINWHQQ